MSEPAPFRRLTFRIVLLKVSPLVARLVSVPDDLSLEELHEVLQLTFGWRCEPFYSFRIHGQEISRRGSIAKFTDYTRCCDINQFITTT